jgi:DNA-binding NtrC family response regulator
MKAISDCEIRYPSSDRWPGNVRELENVIERLVVLAAGPEITDADLPGELLIAPEPRDSFQLELPEAIGRVIRNDNVTESWAGAVLVTTNAE